MRIGKTSVLMMGTVLLLPRPGQGQDPEGRPGAPVDFHVSPAGNDTWSGTRAEPSAARDDGPFATIGRAQAAVRKLLRGLPEPRPVTVVLRGGVYRIEEPLVFTPEDGGSPENPVVYRALEGEQPVISGGRLLGAWREGPEGTWVTDVPEVAAGEWFFSQLFVDGARRPRCRLPNSGYLRIAGPLAPKPKRGTAEWKSKECRSGFYFEPGDVREWPDREGANVFLFHSWTTSVHWIREIDEEKRTLRFTAGSGWPVAYWEKNARYYLENVRAGLDQPGEWYLDRRAGRLHYVPMPGEVLADFTAVAPVAKQLLRLEGEAELGLYVENIHFKGISFRHSAWDLPRDKAHDGQAGISLTGAIYTRGARNCRFENIEVAHVGSYGVWFARGSRNNLLIHSELRDLAGGGVKIGETFTEKNAAAACGENRVENCFIHDGGHLSRAGIGVWVGRSSYNTIRHNEICDFDYSAVSLGWSWGYAASSANHNTVEYNRMHHIGNGVLSDMGGVYCLGISPGTVLRGNVMHDIFSYSYGGWGLYTDEGSSRILMENNIVYNTKSGGFHQHYGRENIVRSNILAFSREGQIIRSREENHLSFTIENNVVVFDNGQPLGGNWKNGNYRFVSNLYWDVTRKPFAFAGYDLQDWQEEGQDTDSVVADPGFRDAEKFDFRPRRGSPVLTYGIDPEAILEKVGLYGDKAWTEKPAQVTHRSLDPDMKPPRKAPRPNVLQRIDATLEDLKVGDSVPFARASGQEKGASIRVSDEVAADGKHSLKFTDAEGLPYNWQPHLSTTPFWSKGTVKGSFDILLRPGAVFWHEWRDRSSPYRVGPSLRFTAAGDLQVRTRDPEGKPITRTLLRYPTEQWIRVELSCTVGRAHAGTYELAVTLPGQEKQTFELSTVSRDWNACMVMVFVSEATKRTEFFLDNIHFERQRRRR